METKIELTKIGLSPAQIELLVFAEPNNANNLSDMIEEVFDLACFISDETLDQDQKDALYQCKLFYKLLRQIHIENGLSL